MIIYFGGGLGVIVTGRLIAGFGVGFESAIVILCVSEIVKFPYIWSLLASSIDGKSGAQRRSVVPLWQATNFASLLDFFLPPLLSTLLITAPTPAPTASQLTSS